MRLETNFTFDISRLINATTGTSEELSFDLPAKFENVNSKANIKGKLQIMRIDEGVNARVYNIAIPVNFVCQKCLKHFSEEIKIKTAERQFYFSEKDLETDRSESFLADSKHQNIDITEALRQEIILHFPLIPVCSRGCQGLCPYCGVDLNILRCDCEKQQSKSSTPLAALRDLFKK